MHPFPTHLFGNHKSVLYDCEDSLHITDICTDDLVEDSSPSPPSPTVYLFTQTWGTECTSVSGHVTDNFRVFFSLLYTPLFARGILSLPGRPRSKVATIWCPYPHFLPLKIHSLHPHPRALPACDHPRSFNITVFAWSLCLPEGSVVASLYLLASPASTKLSEVHILGPW